MSSIADDPSLDKLTPHSVGFLRQIGSDDRREYVPSGSGTLIEVGKIRGIMTAGHVIDKLSKSETIALFTISKTKEKAPRVEFAFSDCQIVKLYDGMPGVDRIDIGFIRLPHNIEQRIGDYLSFYNFDLRLHWAASGKDDTRHFTSEAIVGMIAERSEFVSIKDGMRTESHVMSHAYGLAGPPSFIDSVFDRFEFTINHNEEVPRPKSYGGLSGSAVWKLSDGTGPNDRIIYGVAFYQEVENELGRRRVYCNGPNSVYGALVRAIRNRFPNDFVEVSTA